MTATGIENGKAYETWGSIGSGNYGLIVAPDGVARIQIEIEPGRTLAATVHNNVAVLRLPVAAENLTVYPMTWFNNSGAVVRRFHVGAKVPVAHSHPRYPPRIYPPPTRHPHWGQPGGCASIAGVRPPDHNADARASAAVLILLDDDIKATADRAYWPQFAQDHQRAHLTKSNILAVGPAVRSPYADAIHTNCGPGLVARSIRVVIGPPHALRRAPALTTEYWVLDRRGHWLVWWSQY